VVGEKDLIAKIKKSLIAKAEKDPSWTLFLGKEQLSASDLLKRLDTDKSLRKMVIESSFALAIEMWNNEGRSNIEGNSGST